MREQEPVLYLLHPNSLSAVGRGVNGGKATPFFPQRFGTWSIWGTVVGFKGLGVERVLRHVANFGCIRR